MAEQRQRPLHELLSHHMVNIYVGAENTHWVLHEKLLCHHSAFFRKIFYQDSTSNSSKFFGLPDEDDEPFRQFVGWLYSDHVPPPRQEQDLSVLFEMYLMGEKWQIKGLKRDVLRAIREYYKDSNSYPGLRRVQYIYANTDVESEMRQLLVHTVARMLALSDGIPQHWDKALRKNGQLAVDLIMAIQQWRLDGESVPDARDDPEIETHVKLEQKGDGERMQSELDKVVKKEPSDDEQGEPMTNGLTNGVTNGSAESEHE